MSDRIYTALSGAIASQVSLDVAAHNIANSTTTGFRADRVAFEEALLDQETPPGVPSTNHQVGMPETRIDLSPGTVFETGNRFDMALQGPGFFAVETPDGVRYTRAGSFVTDADGVLRTHGGLKVLGEGGAEIRIPENVREVAVALDGTITADRDRVSQIQITDFSRAEDLIKTGDTLFQANPDATEREVLYTTVIQGSLEGSNVNAIAGMNELIVHTRNYELYNRLIRSLKELEDKSARDLGRRA
jgi:flagellar basal-body rod protein FlgF